MQLNDLTDLEIIATGNYRFTPSIRLHLYVTACIFSPMPAAIILSVKGLKCHCFEMARMTIGIAPTGTARVVKTGRQEARATLS